jgi:hypothetical protein
VTPDASVARSAPPFLTQLTPSDRYSITSSARNRNDSGIASPMAFAAIRLTTSSNLVGCTIHAIAADDVMQGLNSASKLNADWDFLVHLRDIGRERAQVWIENHFDDLGVESTIDIRGTYL